MNSQVSEACSYYIVFENVRLVNEVQCSIPDSVIQKHVLNGHGISHCMGKDMMINLSS